MTNGNGWVRTGAFKKKLAKEERAKDRGEFIGLGGGVEEGERRKRRMLCTEDLKLALRLGDAYLGQTPIIAGGIMHSKCLDTIGIDELYPKGDKEREGERWNVDFLGGGEAMDVDGGEEWVGKEEGGLDGVLDDVLNLAEI